MLDGRAGSLSGRIESIWKTPSKERGEAHGIGACHWVRRYVRGGSAQKLDWLVVEEITQLDMALWADLGRLGLVFAARGPASRPWRRLRLLHRFFNRKYFFKRPSGD